MRFFSTKQLKYLWRLSSVHWMSLVFDWNFSLVFYHTVLGEVNVYKMWCWTRFHFVTNLENERYRMLILGVSDHDTNVQVVGKNLTCNSTSNPIPVFASKFPSSKITNFMYESLAYSAITDTLVACGGMAASQARDCYCRFRASLKFS